MKTLLPALAIVSALGFACSVVAQRGGPPPRGGNQSSLTQRQQLSTNTATTTNMPTIAELAQMMMTNFDTDGSEELSTTELQNALVALRQMMQSQTNGQNQNQLAARQNAIAEQVELRPPPPPPWANNVVAE
ncbi:hypothetical protein SAMN06265222_108136 [Neorhodopirellula lusitana]|uniref:EF-hand domain-containing protein n=1 Tax=Neorhodopirellula lusitana TaxID=445327 RepID=A0ABY1QA13_9BACT|nr:hypothetical protein [Neorhodopirellula lusitana]SMP63799.1 hypothetical protein SAMN06265222_108136 [Neorhodopirellula lusitana]